MVTDPKRKSWIERLKDITARFQEQFPSEPTLALAILPVNADGLKAGEEVYVAGPIEAYLEHMQLKFSTMVNFAQRRADF
jgi:hypothetical protein